MSRTKKRGRGRGRPPKGKNARTIVVPVKFSARELAAIDAAVEKENAELVADGNDDGTSATRSSWIRDHALDPLGLATHEGER